jgi:uncharacterized protein (UPF0212 family)
MIFAPQTHYCPNCGEKQKSAAISMNHVQSMMCSNACREEWELKYARMILGKEEPTK